MLLKSRGQVTSLSSLKGPLGTTGHARARASPGVPAASLAPLAPSLLALVQPGVSQC